MGGSGTAAVALAACGTAAEPREEGDDGELLGTAAAAENAYGLAAAAFGDQQGVSSQIKKSSAARLDELKAAGTTSSGPTGGEEGGPENVSEAAAAAIAAYRQGARLLSTTELRTTATQFLAQVAGELAALRELGDEDPIVQYAFVTGLDTPPQQKFDDAPTGQSTTTTTGSSTTSTTEGG